MVTAMGIASAIAAETLLPSAKNYLDITWQDNATDEKLVGILRRGMKDLNRIAGAELDYSQEDKPRSLLFDYARYARSNALDEFWSNYQSDLLALQIGSAIGWFGGDADDPQE